MTFDPPTGLRAENGSELPMCDDPMRRSACSAERKDVCPLASLTDGDVFAAHDDYEFEEPAEIGAR